MKLSVKKLSKDVTKQDLEELFEPYSVTNIDFKEAHEGNKFAFIELPDQMAKKAVEELNNFLLKGKNIRVQIRDESNPATQQTDQKKENPHFRQKDASSKKDKTPYTGTFPYDFFKRKANKESLSEFHDRLLSGRYDIAFEIEWETLTPTALNPVLDEKEQSCYPKNNDNEYSGYNRRWLLIDEHLAISPFTIKSAIANGFANLLGGCYRVNNITEGHKENLGKGKYLYSGVYKRYRVAMDGSSKPGIVKSIRELKNKENKDREISIQPVKEYYLDEELPGELKNIKQGDEVFAKIIQNRKHKPPIIQLVKTHDANCKKLKYHGPFRYGKDSKHHYRHKYRFYNENGNEVSGIIPAINFKSKEELKKVVSIGGADPKDKPTEWYQDLNDIKVGSLVYYETFGGKVTNIGKNFLFKALFHHEDTVPEENSECINITGNLCPRCRMFGLTDKTKNENAIIGYKGRFKSSAFINHLTLTERENPDFISVRDINIKGNIPLKVWVDANTKDVIATQEFLPISSSPKPNRRDINGYFNRETGNLKGAKYYLHGKLNSARNIQGVDAKNDEDYSHKLRNYAQVVRPHLLFTGTVGAENCNLEEITAFLMLLHSDFSNHGFKIGLGKAFGMGSVKSSIRKIWIRKNNDYENWHIIENKGTKKDLLSQLETQIKGITNTYEKFEGVIVKTEKIFNKLKGMENRSLKYPEVIDKDKEQDKKQKDKEQKDKNEAKNKKKDYWELAFGNK